MRDATDQRLFAICEAFRRGMDVEEIYQLTSVDPWFLKKVKDLVDAGEQVPHDAACPTKPRCARAKVMGFNDHALADIVGCERDRNPRLAPPVEYPTLLQIRRHLRRGIRIGDAVLLFDV